MYGEGTRTKRHGKESQKGNINEEMMEKNAKEIY